MLTLSMLGIPMRIRIKMHSWHDCRRRTNTMVYSQMKCGVLERKYYGQFRAQMNIIVLHFPSGH